MNAVPRTRFPERDVAVGLPDPPCDGAVLLRREGGGLGMQVLDEFCE